MSQRSWHKLIHRAIPATTTTALTEIAPERAGEQSSPSRRGFLTHAAALGMSLAQWPLLARAQTTMPHHADPAAGMHHDMAGMNMMMMPGDVPIEELPLPRASEWQTVSVLPNESSKPGVFRGTLVAAPLTLELVPGKPTQFYAYNGKLPGPLLEWQEGQQVEMRIVNQLNEPHTVHWHGLPVPADADGNPHQPIAPGAERTVRFTVPRGTAATYWYHPHTHLLTGHQARMGLAGPIIVRAQGDPLREVPERLLVISELKLAADGSMAPNTMLDWMNGREGQFNLVNAAWQPQARFDASGRERWRVINACSARLLRLALPGMRLVLVGTDGGLFERPVPVEEYLLTPGARAEFIVESAGQRGTVTLSALPYERGKGAMAAMMGMNLAPDAERPLLQLDCSGVRNETLAPLPTRLRLVDDLGKIGSASARKRLVFTEQMGAMGAMGATDAAASMSMPGKSGMAHHTMHMPATPMSHDSPQVAALIAAMPKDMGFLINNRRFDMRRVDLRSRRNEVELWELVNNSDMDHPFHLHGTQFQVIERERDGKVTKEPFLAWYDMVNLRPRETVRIKTVQRYAGVRMFHCHILEHEDLGMMGQLLVA